MNYTKHLPMETIAFDGDGKYPVKITFEVDWLLLARSLATKAYKNKSGQTILMNGLIVATVNDTRARRKAREKLT